MKYRRSFYYIFQKRTSMENVFLISENTIKRESLITDNVDSKYINVAIQDAQRQGLEPLIGTHLYDSVCEKVSNGTIDNSDNQFYKALLDVYITPFLVWKSMATIQMGLYAKFTNNGMKQNAGENSNNISLKDIQYLVEYYNNKSTYYSNRMSDYLNAYSTNFPEYRNLRNVADIQGNKSNYNTTIVL